MEVNTNKEVTVTITLSSTEANILADLLQNSQVPYEEELVETRKLREQIFNACRSKELTWK